MDDTDIVCESQQPLANPAHRIGFIGNDGAEAFPVKQPTPAIKRKSKLLLERLTDVGNGKRLVRRHGTDIRYCYATKQWLIWDSRRWKEDSGAEIERRAKETARSIFSELASTAEDDSVQRKDLIKWGLESEKMRNIRSMIDAAKSETGIAIEATEFDCDQCLLNCANGIIDLRTGKLLPHDKAVLMSKLCPTHYNPKAEAPTFRAFLDSIFSRDAALIGYVQRLCGYWLTGSVREHILPIAVGGGRNGKTTLVNAFAKTLGEDYCITADKSIVIAGRKGSSTERMDLFGRRLALVMETDEGEKFAEAFVEQLTGADPVRGRRHYENTWQYDPTHKVLLVTNHEPQVAANDDAFWDRVKLIRFGVRFTEADQDKELPEKLLAEAPGILAWAVQGCLDWQRNGLCEPDSVRRATTEYRLSQDTFGQFIADCCTLAPTARVKLTELTKRYRQWASENAEQEIKPKDFAKRLKSDEYKCESYTNNGTWYRGVGLRTE